MSRLVCLLPARNAEADLPGYLESVTRFADGVVALDDGSTDRTRAILEGHPLVRVLLHNPPRESYAGWHDGANRQRLLDAAEALHPDWVMFLDADERIDEGDAMALRRFVDTDALRGCAYGFQHLRMWGRDHHDPRVSWVYRLFAYEGDLALPEERLHFNPVPASLPRRSWIRTTIRIQHLAASTEERRRARLAKYHEADPGGSYRTNFGGLDEAPEGDLARWEPRRADLAVLLPPDAPGPDLLGDGGGPGVAVVCLLPARNAEADLPGYFDSVARFADAVVALDDGSTDRTGEILEGHPLVRVALRNPRRESYAGWHDAANRNRLLRAAADLGPTWVMSLDADERIDEDDARALRSFLDREGRRDLAYGFRVFRMIEDQRHYDRADLWVFRLFAFERGQSFPEWRLHFVPIPQTIPRTRWVRTTVRIQHLAGLTEERRRERHDKYVAADPGRRFQPSYGQLLEPPGELKPWEPRPPDLPVLAVGTGVERRVPVPDELDLEGPVLSAVVIARDDETTIKRSVRSVVEQKMDAPFEVIVVATGTDRTADVVRGAFPDVRVIELPGVLPGAARNAGLRASRGDYVSFPGSHVELPQGSLAARVRAHERGYPMVTGTTLNGTPTPSGWASYFLDHATVLPGRPSEELGAPPAHCSYARDFLLQFGGFPEDMRAGEDTVVNLALYRMGYRTYRAADVQLVHRSPCTTFPRLLRHHFVRGRAMGRIVRDGQGPRLSRFLLGYVPWRVRRISHMVERWGEELEPIYRRVLPMVAAGAATAWAGLWYELLRSPEALAALLAGPPVTILVAGVDRRPGEREGRADAILLVRIDPPGRGLRIAAIPRDLLVEVPGVGLQRLNDAFALGVAQGGDGEGATLLRRTIEEALEVPVDEHVVVDLDGFRRLVDALGGIEVDVPHDIHDEFVGKDGQLFAAHFSAGIQRMSGDAALRYARTRKDDGDVWRRTRHAQVALAALDRLKDVRSPGALIGAARAALSSVHTSLRPTQAVALTAAAARVPRSRVDLTVVAEPVVQSVRVDGLRVHHRGEIARVDRAWAHEGDLEAVGAYVRESLAVQTPESASSEDAPRPAAAK